MEYLAAVSGWISCEDWLVWNHGTQSHEGLVQMFLLFKWVFFQGSMLDFSGVFVEHI